VSEPRPPKQGAPAGDDARGVPVGGAGPRANRPARGSASGRVPGPRGGRAIRLPGGRGHRGLDGPLRALKGALTRARELLLRENPAAGRDRTGLLPTRARWRATVAGSTSRCAIHAVERMLGTWRSMTRCRAPNAPATPAASAVVARAGRGSGAPTNLARLGYGVHGLRIRARAGGRAGARRHPRVPAAQGGARRPRSTASARSGRRACECNVRVGRDVPFEDLASSTRCSSPPRASPARLGIPGEGCPGVRRGLDFLRDVKRGPAAGDRAARGGGRRRQHRDRLRAPRCASAPRPRCSTGAAAPKCPRMTRKSSRRSRRAFARIPRRPGRRDAGRWRPGVTRSRRSRRCSDEPQPPPRRTGSADSPAPRRARRAPRGAGAARCEPIEGTEFFVPADTGGSPRSARRRISTTLPDDCVRRRRAARQSARRRQPRAAVRRRRRDRGAHTVAFALGPGSAPRSASTGPCGCAPATSPTRSTWASCAGAPRGT